MSLLFDMSAATAARYQACPMILSRVTLRSRLRHILTCTVVERRPRQQDNKKEQGR